MEGANLEWEACCRCGSSRRVCCRCGSSRRGQQSLLIWAEVVGADAVAREDAAAANVGAGGAGLGQERLLEARLRAERMQDASTETCSGAMRFVTVEVSGEAASAGMSGRRRTLL